MNEQGDPTIVTGSPVSTAGGPRPGEVLGERYEVLAPLGRDAFTLDYRAFDQELEEQVLVRVVSPALCAGEEAKAVARRLSRVVGIGGKYLSALVDAYWEQPHLFVVEALPKGTTLREVVQARMARGERIEAEEMLPVAARLAAALEAVPPPFRHGNVRAETVFIDPEDLQVSCPFLLGSLPHEAVRRTLEADPRLSRAFAPEVAEGAAGDAADRFGVACVVYEGLTGRLPEPGVGPPEELGAIGEALVALLERDPAARPASLTGLIEALATSAGLPVPELPAGAFRRPRRLSVRRKSEKALPAVIGSLSLREGDTDPSSEQIVAPDTDPGPPSSPEEDDGEDTRRVVQPSAGAGPSPAAAAAPRARRVAGAAPEGTQEIDASELLEEVPAPATAAALPGRRDPQASDPGLDPRLVRAALGVELEGSGERQLPPGESRSPSSRPPRAGPGPARRPGSKAPPAAGPRPKDPTLELGPDDLEMVQEQVRKQATLELGPDDLEMVQERARKLPSLDQPTPSQRAAAERRRKHATPARVVRLPADIKPIPRPRLDPTPAPLRAAPAPVLFDDSRLARPPSGRPLAAPAVLPAAAAPPPPGPAPAMDERPGPGPLASEPTMAGVSYERPLPVAGPRWGRWLLLVAVVLAAIIIAGGFLVARERRIEAERERRLQERYHQLQDQTD